MTEQKIGRHKVVIFDSIEELPIKRFHLFNKSIIIDSGIGSSVEEIVVHIVRVKRFIEVNDKESANTELDNLILSFKFAFENIDVTSKAFCYLIHSIDGKIYTDFSDVGIDELQSKIHKWSRSLIVNLIESVKKKMESELNLFFQGRFDTTSKEKEYYGALKSRTLLMIDSLINRKSHKERINGIDNQLLKLSKPTKFMGSSGFEVRYTKNFEKSCLMVGKYYQTDIEKVSTLRYFQALEILEKNEKR